MMCTFNISILFLLSLSVMLFAFLPLLHSARHLFQDLTGGSDTRTDQFWGTQSTVEDLRGVWGPLNDAPSCLQVSVLLLVHWQSGTKGNHKVRKMRKGSPFNFIIQLTMSPFLKKIFFSGICLLEPFHALLIITTNLFAWHWSSSPPG